MKINYLIYILIINLYIDLLKLQASDTVQTFIEEKFFWEEERYNSVENAEGINYEMNYDIFSKIEINTATAEDWAELNILTNEQINEIILYRKQFGYFYSIYELCGVRGINKNDVDRLLPFVYVEPVFFNNINKKTKFKQKLNIYTQQTLQNRVGYRINDTTAGLSNYLGDPMHFRFKYWLQNHTIKFNIAMEKDPGEKWIMHKPLTPDFFSMSFQLSNFKIFKKLIIGDYVVQIGQGLVAWNGTEFGPLFLKGEIFREISTLKLYSSYNEYSFLRGTCAILELKNWNYMFYLSNNKKDANIYKYDSLNNPISVKSIISDGIHAEVNQINKRKNLNENIIGTAITKEWKNWLLGLQAQYIRYSLPFDFEHEPHNMYYIKGNKQLLTSLFYRVHKRYIRFYGEVARLLNHGNAWIQGISIIPLNNIIVNILYRNYDAAYYSPYARAYSQNSKISNQVGFATNIFFKPVENIEISVLSDTYKSKWLQYRVSEPIYGYEGGFQIVYYRSDARYFIRGRYIQKQEDVQGQELGEVKFPVAKIKNQISVGFVIPLNSYGNFKQTWNYNICKKTTTDKAIGVLNEITYLKYTKLNLTLGYILFNTDSWEGRIYFYEKGLFQGGYFPALYDKGMRSYCLLKYTLRKFSVGIKYTFSYYPYRHTIGSGNNLIEGNKMSDLAVQIQLKN